MPKDTTEPVMFDTRTGGIVLTIGEESFTLRHPTFGELRALLVAAEKVDQDNAKPDEPDAPTKIFDLVQGNIEWWQITVKTLSEKEVPPVEECPVWLGAPDLLQRATAHWLTVPTQAPGN